MLAKELVGRTVVTKSGKTFGTVGDIVFEARTGEIINIVLKNPTQFAKSFSLEKDSEGNLLIPYHAVVSVGDFIIVAEDDIV